MLRVKVRIISNGYGEFQWAPTLGGECYLIELIERGELDDVLFQWAPTLGGECYFSAAGTIPAARACFNGHPPLGVNATHWLLVVEKQVVLQEVSMGTHPWG